MSSTGSGFCGGSPALMLKAGWWGRKMGGRWAGIERRVELKGGMERMDRARAMGMLTPHRLPHRVHCELSSLVLQIALVQTLLDSGARGRGGGGTLSAHRLRRTVRREFTLRHAEALYRSGSL